MAYKHALLLEKSNPPAAQKAYENNTRQFAGDYRNYLRLGLLLSANKETFAKAAQFLKKTTALADTISSVWLELGRVYGKMGSEQDELETYRHYLQIDPQNAEANKRAGVILAKKGQMSDALIYLEVANTLTPNDPEVMFSLGKGIRRDEQGEGGGRTSEKVQERPDKTTRTSALCFLKYT